MHKQPNVNGLNVKFNNLYGNARINWIRNNEILQLILDHMNSSLVEKWESSKLPAAKTTQEDFNKIHLLPISQSKKVTNHQACLVGTKTSKGWKSDDIELIANSIIEPAEVQEIRTTEPMIIIRGK